jgi:hypothetical protein
MSSTTARRFEPHGRLVKTSIFSDELPALNANR